MPKMKVDRDWLRRGYWWEVGVPIDLVEDMTRVQSPDPGGSEDEDPEGGTGKQSRRPFPNRTVISGNIRRNRKEHVIR